MSYDVLYQEWLEAKAAKNYELADTIRTQFEREHHLTIFAEGVMPVIGVTVHRMSDAAWHKKYGNPKVGAILEQWDSRTRYISTNQA